MLCPFPAWRSAILPIFYAALLLVGFAGMAEAQPGKPADSLSCRRQCDAPYPDRIQNSQAVQACLVRCAAGERHLSRQHQRGTAEATGRGSTAPQPNTPLSAGVPSIWPPRPGMGSSAGPAASAPVMPAAGVGRIAAGRSIVAYVAPPPGRAFSLSNPVERMAAHRGAETDCFRRNNNNPCRLLAETQDRCLSVAYGIRANGLVITSDPRTFTIMHYGTGTGADTASADAQAMRDCSGRISTGVQCRIAANRCD